MILKLGQGPGLKRNELIAKQSVFLSLKFFDYLKIDELEGQQNSFRLHTCKLVSIII